MFPNLVKKRKELQSKVTAHEEYLAKGKVGEDYDPPNSELKVESSVFAEEVRKQVKEIEDCRKEVDDLAAVHQADVNLKTIKKTSLESDPEAQDGGLHDPGQKGKSEPEGDGAKSLGKLFVESKAYTEYARGSASGPLAEEKMSRAQMKDLFTTTPGGGRTGWDPQDIRTGIVSLYPTRPAPQVIDFIPQIPTSQTAVVYMEETTFTNAAAEIAEAVSKTSGDYGEAAVGLTQRSRPVEKIAVWLPVTDEQLEDIDQIESYIDQRLRLMVNQRIDLQVILGNGTAPNLLGTSNVSGIQSIAKGNDSIPDAIYKGIVEVMADGFASPTVIFIHPRKWRDVVLLKTSDGQYIWGHPAMPGPKTLWGVPIIETTAITESLALTGDYQMHSLFALKRGIDMQISDSHGEYFTKGIKAIRMDMRGSMVHIRPKAFAEITDL